MKMSNRMHITAWIISSLPICLLLYFKIPLDQSLVQPVIINYTATHLLRNHIVPLVFALSPVQGFKTQRSQLGLGHDRLKYISSLLPFLLLILIQSLYPFKPQTQSHFFMIPSLP